MHSYKIFYFFLLWMSFSITSCIIDPQPLEVELPAVKPKLVVSTLTLQPFGTVLLVSKSFDAITVDDTLNFDSTALLNKILVSDAEVEISYGLKKVKLKEIAPGIYGSLELEYLEGINYSLFVRDPVSGLEVTAATTYSGTVADFEVEPIAQNDTTYTYRTTWTDGQRQHFLVTANKLSANNKILKNVEKDFLKYISSSYAIQSIADRSPQGSYAYEPLITPYSKGDTILVSLSAITLDHFIYLSAYKKRGSILNQVLAEPIRSLPSNVKDGYGYFALFGTKAKIVVLK